MTSHVRLLPPPEDRGPLRVTFVTKSLSVGGAERLLVDLVRSIDRDRFSPQVVCLKDPGPLAELLAEELPLRHGLLRHGLDVLVLNKLSRLLAERRADAVVTVGAGDAMLWGRLAARRAGVPVVVSALHSTGRPDRVSRLNRLLNPLTDAFVAVAESHRQRLIDQEALPRRKVVAIRNGVDVSAFAPRTDGEEVRRELRIEPDVPVCGVVAALRPEKHLELFLRVAALVRIERPTAQFVVVGEGSQQEALQELAARWGLQDCVHFLGRRNDVARILSAIDVFLLTSHTEASPVTLLEAMACGRPCVATDVGGVSETVQHGVTGYVTAPGDAERMCRRTMALLRDVQRRRKMGAAGREWVVEHGSLQGMVDGYQELIDGLYRRACEPPRGRVGVATLEEAVVSSS